MIGMSRESINKQLRIWEDKKWVRLERNAVVILATEHRRHRRRRCPLRLIGGVSGSSADGRGESFGHDPDTKTRD
jgi:hypothetical protein